MFNKTFTAHLQNIRLAACLGLGLCVANAGWAKPSIQSVGVTPNPLIIGRTFTVTVAASPDVTQAAAVLETRKAQPALIEFSLSKQGTNWVGSGTLPVNVSFDDPLKAEARVKVLVLDAALRRTEESVRVPVIVPDISAVFAAGVLTITCDDHDNSIIVSPDAAGLLTVNGGAIPISGGPAVMTNTTLIRILAMAGHDIIEIAQSSGMPPADLQGGEGNDTLFGGLNNDLLDGGPGNDQLFGRSGLDTLMGGADSDTLAGGQGVDQLFGGPGDDEVQWNPGDASDLIEGEEGEDTLRFNGANIAETIDIAANTNRLRFFRNVASILLDCAGIDRVVCRSLGGADQISVSDLTGTEVSQVIVDLEIATGGGDLQPDAVFVLGTQTNDVLRVTGSTNGVNVLGLGAAVTVLGAELSVDRLVVNGMGEADDINASALVPDSIDLTLDGGLGMDIITGSQGNDTLLGGRDSDHLSGGPGEDTFVWNPGDGLDTLEGDAGMDRLLFNGANVSEVIDIAADGPRVRFTRNVASITLDCHKLEQIHFNASGGSDTITVNDLTGTDVTTVNLNLGLSGTSNPDNQADSIVVKGTAGNDVAAIAGLNGVVSVTGLAATVNIFGADAALDNLFVLLFGGDDVANAADLPAGLINLIIDGGIDHDFLTGSGGDDILLGDEGDDILVGGPGIDALDGGNGNNVLIQD